MVELTAEEKAAITDVWNKVKAEELGSERLERLLTVFPYTKKYFEHFEDVSFCAATEGNPKLRALGKKLLDSMIVIVLSRHFGNKFTPAVQAAFQKVVAAVSAAMAYKYY